MKTHMENLEAAAAADSELREPLQAVLDIVAPLIISAPVTQEHPTVGYPIVLLEGLDGCGKTTVKQALLEQVGSLYGTTCVSPRTCTTYPSFGCALDALEIAAPRHAVFAKALSSLFPLGNLAMCAAMRDASRVKVVVMDRFWGSSAVYAAARADGELPGAEDACWQMPSEMLTVLSGSHVCLYLQLGEEARAQRVAARDEISAEERRIAADPTFRARLLAGFQRLRLGCPVLRIDAGQTREQVVADVVAAIAAAYPPSTAQAKDVAREATAGGQTLRAAALFLKRGPVAPRPFADGVLDLSTTVERTIHATPMAPSPAVDTRFLNCFTTKGLGVIALQRHLACAGVEPNAPVDETRIRQAVRHFWGTDGAGLLSARAPPGRDRLVELLPVPTHATERRAPPDGMRLAHVDYPSLTLRELLGEWWSRWEGPLEPHGGSPEELAARYRLVGVLTLWICLQPPPSRIEDQPLLVADASSVDPARDLTTYAVPRSKGARHSVGLHYSDSHRWHSAPTMGWGDAWVFDTLASPHVSVDLGVNSQFVRRSVEVRTLVLEPQKRRRES